MNVDFQHSAGKPPLVLGASGRIGTGFQRLAQMGEWPGPAPQWQVRCGAEPAPGNLVYWDILAENPPEFGPCQGIICLAGVVNGDLALNTALALAAIDLAVAKGCGPVLLTSTSAVYGPADQPVTEHSPCNPANAYGRAKLAMERAVSNYLHDLGDTAPVVCILRIGNVAGADALLLAAQSGVVTLDRFDDGQGPERSYIGMRDLAGVMTHLIGLSARSVALPQILNIAADQPLAMTALLQAAGLDWLWRSAPPMAVRRMVLDTTLLQSLIAAKKLSADPAEMIRQSRLAGWAPAEPPAGYPA